MTSCVFDAWVAIDNLELAGLTLQHVTFRISMNDPRRSHSARKKFDHVVQGSLMSQVTEIRKSNIFLMSAIYLCKQFGNTR